MTANQNVTNDPADVYNIGNQTLDTTFDPLLILVRHYR
jgi:hypothetical protein